MARRVDFGKKYKLPKIHDRKQKIWFGIKKTVKYL